MQDKDENIKKLMSVEKAGAFVERGGGFKVGSRE
jgi:hypothetical protein